MKDKDYIKIIKKKNKLINNYEKEIELLKKQNEYYRRIACTDSLTHLGNRRSLEKAFNYDSVILGDIDHFKMINDKYGHKSGDLVLIEVSNVFKKFVRESDLVCRWGGEEFVILLKNCTNEDAYKKAMQLKDQISLLSNEFGFKISMSFGISSILDKPLSKAIEEADQAMYKSKEDGRDRVTVYTLSM